MKQISKIVDRREKDHRNKMKRWHVFFVCVWRLCGSDPHQSHQSARSTNLQSLHKKLPKPKIFFMLILVINACRDCEGQASGSREGWGLACLMAVQVLSFAKVNTIQELT